jgi:phage tail sheath protein FI
MAERLHPGVYVEEVSSGIRPIEGAGTSTAAFVGSAARGMPGAQFLTSFDEYVRLYGGHLPGEDGFLAAAVEAFFSAGGKRAFAVRVLPAGAERGQSDPVEAHLDPAGIGTRPLALMFRAKGAGDWSDAIRIRISTATHFPLDAFKVEVLWVDSGGSKTVETFDDLRMDSQSEDYVQTVVNGASKYVEAIDLLAVDRDAEAPAYAPLPEQSAALVAAPGKDLGLATVGYTVRRNAELVVRGWDESAPDAKVEGKIVFSDAALTAAAAKSFVQGRADITTAQLSTLITTAIGAKFRVLAGAGPVPPRIEAKFATRAYLIIAPPAGSTTFNLVGKTLSLSTDVDGAVTSVQIFPPALPADNPPVPAAVTLPQLLGLAQKVLPVGFTAELRDKALVVRGPRRDDEIALDTVLNPADVVGDPPTLLRSGLRGHDGAIAESLNAVHLSISETRLPFVTPVLGDLGFPVRARGYEEGNEANPLALPAAAPNLRLRGGTDGPANAVLTVTDFNGAPEQHTGLHALDGIDVNLVALPGKNTPEFLAGLMAYVDRRADCFAVCDGPGSLDRDFDMTAQEAKQFVEGLPTRSKNAAIYYPWVRMPDPTGVGKAPSRFLPPSGLVAGIYARTDINRGVWKAPAGIEAVVSGSLGLQVQVLDADQDILNPFSLNCLRQFPGAGIVIWGARTLASDAEWKYVPVRRTALFLKESIRRGIQWAVFEPNDANLWAQIKTNITAFMMTVFRQGGFQGANADEAFRVICDRSTNPQDQVDAGIVTAKVAFAPLKPAEFVVIEISQKSLVS